MKITRVEALPIDRYLFPGHTDEGIPCGVRHLGPPGGLASAIEKFGRYLVGEDPGRIEHHWNVMYRSGHFRGAAIMGALSAIDIALWDIKGKALRRPVYHLLGGKTPRQGPRLLPRLRPHDRASWSRGCVEPKARGFTAVGHLTPFPTRPRDQPYFKTHAAEDRDAIETVRLPRGGGRRGGPLHRDPPPASPRPRRSCWRAASSPSTHSSTRTRSCPTTSTRWAEVASRSTSRSPPASACTPSTSSRCSWPAAACSTSARTSACAAGSPGRRRSPRWRRRTTWAWSPTTRSPPVSTGRLSPAGRRASPTSPSRSIPSGGRAPQERDRADAVRCEDGFLIIPDTPGIGMGLAP